MTPNHIATEIFQTDLGWIAIAANHRGIVRTSLPEPTPESALQSIEPTNTKFETSKAVDHSSGNRPELLAQTKDLLTRYCNGEDVRLADIPIDDTAWTPYTSRARAACREIPRGQTRTYAWLAQQASGNTNSARAAGRAMATNPTPIIVPCHRVIATNGHLNGFGGTIGLPLKQRLLQMEGAI
ncbi:MAG: methylated-DNA--[protein]-cysteine S-methyltransferase [Chloroflexi bacterium]|nr:methylated-DNA--[protein]-cysteine S-methyltransferase [Chloroflexota bacterium]